MELKAEKERLRNPDELTMTMSEALAAIKKQFPHNSDKLLGVPFSLTLTETMWVCHLGKMYARSCEAPRAMQIALAKALIRREILRLEAVGLPMK